MRKETFKLSVAIATSVTLSGCAGPMLNQYTTSLGPRIGNIQEAEVLENLDRYVDNPWAIPGHVELAAGQVQVTNMVGLNLKYPDLKTVAQAVATTVTHSSTREFDLTPAQTQDQESYNILPVTDPDDLRRLRALYHYAVCPEPDRLALEWGIAAQTYYSPPVAGNSGGAPKNPTVPTETVSEHVKLVLYKLAAGDETLDEARTDILKFAKVKETDAIKAQLNAVLGQIKINPVPSYIVNQIIGAIGVPPNAPGGQGAGGAKTSSKTPSAATSSGGDNRLFEKSKLDLIVNPDIGLGTERWLYWRQDDGTLVGGCAGRQPEIPKPGAHLISLGIANGREFFASDPKKFSDLVLFILGGIPNTVGAHIEDTGGGASKAAASTSLPLPGQPIISTKHL